ncbi:MAG: type II toxin-antitoxin system RelE/ParE family toxin [Verrucomicrobiota bacterium]
MPLDFHPLAQKDFNEIIRYYDQEAGAEIADRFEVEFRAAVEAIKAQPTQFPFYLKQRRLRRFRLPTFPHLILFQIKSPTIRVMVLKHVRRAPGLGLKR